MLVQIVPGVICVADLERCSWTNGFVKTALVVHMTMAWAIVGTELTALVDAVETTTVVIDLKTSAALVL